VKSVWLAGAAALALAFPALAQDAAPEAAPESAPADHHDMASMPGMAAPAMDMSSMDSALGPYRMTRDASGTSWQPDASHHDAYMVHSGGWMLMGHALINGVYDSQSGPRGGDKAYLAGMIMGEASHSLGEGNAIQLRAMLSPDPFMGPSGYPLLLGTGETADGKHPLIDRQHPHDLFMELSAAVSHQIGVKDSVYLYAGLPGEPALGPPAFMHRMSGADDPEAPITHHWLDSTHITYGVITTGWQHGPVKIEASVFKGREPDQRRFDIETPKLDSEAVRVSYNPTANWSLQTSWGHITSPEALEPTVNEDRWTASAIYTRPFGKDGWWSTTAAVGVKRESYGQTLNGFLLESAFHPNDAWTFFTRDEIEQNNELLADDSLEDELHPGPTTAYSVGKISVGAIHDWRVAPHLKVGLGALYDWAFVPEPLRAVYGDDPHGVMGFMRLKID
jgi:hypothetical protein